MDNQNKPKWYFKSWSLVVSFLCIGPLMLPLVWVNPRFSKKTKIFITIIAVILSYIMASFLVNSLKSILSYYQLLSGS